MLCYILLLLLSNDLWVARYSSEQNMDIFRTWNRCLLPFEGSHTGNAQPLKDMDQDVHVR